MTSYIFINVKHRFPTGVFDSSSRRNTFTERTGVGNSEITVGSREVLTCIGLTTTGVKAFSPRKTTEDLLSKGHVERVFTNMILQMSFTPSLSRFVE